MEQELKPWCVVDVKSCTCDPGQCIGIRHKAAIDQYNSLARYGLTTDEIFEDMAMKENKT